METTHVSGRRVLITETEGADDLAVIVACIMLDQPPPEGVSAPEYFAHIDRQIIDDLENADAAENMKNEIRKYREIGKVMHGIIASGMKARNDDSLRDPFIRSAKAVLRYNELLAKENAENRAKLAEGGLLLGKQAEEIRRLNQDLAALTPRPERPGDPLGEKDDPLATRGEGITAGHY